MVVTNHLLWYELWFTLVHNSTSINSTNMEVISTMYAVLITSMCTNEYISDFDVFVRI